jgi:hypothetical protein
MYSVLAVQACVYVVLPLQIGIVEQIYCAMSIGLQYTCKATTHSSIIIY